MKNNSDNKICSTLLKLERCQALIDFTLFDFDYTGHNIGRWLEDTHKLVGCFSDYIGSNMIDSANIAGKVVEESKWNTGHERTTHIVTSKCDAYQINTTEKRASDTSAYKINLNLEIGTLLTLFHTTLHCVTNSAA